MSVTTEINEYIKHPNKDEPRTSNDNKKLPKDWYNAIAYIPEYINYTDVYTIYNFICITCLRCKYCL